MTDKNVSEQEALRPKNQGREIETPDPSFVDSPYGITSRAAGASVIQVDVGVSRFAAILLFITALISAASFVGLLFTMSALKTVSAQYQILQYDHQALKAQLVAKGVYQGTEH